MVPKWLSLAFTFLVAYPNVQAQTAAQLAQKTFPSVVMIVTSDASGQPLALGSGFLVGDGEIATNLHVIEGAAAARIKLIGQSETYSAAGVLGADTTADLALIKVNGLSAAPLQLRESGEATVGEQVFAVGNPEGLEGTFSQGIVSGLRTVSTDKLIQITAPISPGSSGGPVIDSTGRVIGIAVATYREGQNLNFAVPVSYLRALIAQSAGGSAAPLATVDSNSSSHSFVAQMGNAAVTGVTGGKFLWESEFGGPMLGSGYSFTVSNHLGQPVEDIYGLVIFYAQDGTPLDAETFDYRGEIPPGLGRRITGGADPSVKEMTTAHASTMTYSLTPSTKVEFRILNFEIAK